MVRGTSISERAAKINEAFDHLQYCTMNEDIRLDIWIPRSWCIHNFGFSEADGEAKFGAGICKTIHDFLNVSQRMSNRVSIIRVEKFPD